ncbi:MAG: hypothetical protein ACI9QN_002300 [Arcticibacterium sp.]|jgi:hypothetical protein
MKELASFLKKQIKAVNLTDLSGIAPTLIRKIE